MVRSALAVGVSGVALVLAGCGGGDSTPATVQQQAAKAYEEQLGKVGGLKVDKDCIEKETSTLSDAEAQTVLDALKSNEKLPAEFKAFTDAVGDCLSA